MRDSQAINAHMIAELLEQSLTMVLEQKKKKARRKKIIALNVNTNMLQQPQPLP